MKIQAKIPFTYLDPEEEPSEPVYYITKQSITTVEIDGINGGQIETTDTLESWLNSMPDAPASLKIEFEGKVYDCATKMLNDQPYWGATVTDRTVDWREYPFVVINVASLLTKIAGTYEVGIVAPYVATLSISSASDSSDELGLFAYVPDENNVFFFDGENPVFALNAGESNEAVVFPFEDNGAYGYGNVGAGDGTVTKIGGTAEYEDGVIYSVSLEASVSMDFKVEANIT